MIAKQAKNKPTEYRQLFSKQTKIKFMEYETGSMECFQAKTLSEFLAIVDDAVDNSIENWVEIEPKTLGKMKLYILRQLVMKGTVKTGDIELMYDVFKSDSEV